MALLLVACMPAVQILCVPAARARPWQAGDVVVAAPRMTPWRGVLIMEKDGKGDDRTRCRVLRSAGDAAADVQGCAATQACYEAARPAIAAARQAGPATRRRLLAAANRDLAACFDGVSRRFAFYPPGAPSAPQVQSGPAPRPREGIGR